METFGRCVGNSEGDTPLVLHRRMRRQPQGGPRRTGRWGAQGPRARFLRGPPKAVLGGAEAGLFPLESLEEGVPLGERGGGVLPLGSPTDFAGAWQT
ncbi:UNVERIFIED_CONTAM: hypothetical protein Slati_3472800 [Sesamum latifolium]|uniref:Uncharacterized protein n=1 Tax=Sesamum latifolium TaxID=2727402 RepID=A0AAW2UGK9_9LAMI